MLLDDAGSLQAEHQNSVGSCEFEVVVALGGLDKDDTAINLNHNHDICVSPS